MPKIDRTFAQMIVPLRRRFATIRSAAPRSIGRSEAYRSRCAPNANDRFLV